MNNLVDDLPEGFIEVEPELLLALALYALKDPIMAATESMVMTDYCGVKLMEPSTIILSFNAKFGLFADVPKSDFDKIKKAYLQVDHEVQRFNKLN